MLHVIERKDGTNEVITIKNVVVHEYVTTYTFDEPVTIMAGDQLLIYSDMDTNRILQKYIPDASRQAEMKRFMDDGFATEEYMKWLGGNGVARYLCESYMDTDELGQLLEESLSQVDEDEIP